MNPYFVAVIYVVVATAVIPLGFAIFHTKYQLADVLLAVVAGAATWLIPTVGGIASLVVTVGILYWRLGRGALFPDIVVSVLVARLVMVPVLILFVHR